MKCVHVDGYMISVSKDTQPGQYIYFPVGCQIANKYLAANNLFRHNEFNANKEASPGFLLALRMVYLKLTSLNALDSWERNLNH